MSTKTKQRRPKVHLDGRIRSHFAFKPHVYDALAEISEADRRSMTEQLSWLVLERKRALDLQRKVTQ